MEQQLKLLSTEEINRIEDFRKAKQTAVLVIVFSDIVNSTYATEKLGEQSYSKLRHIHDDLFKGIMCRDQAGIIIKEIGDSFLCVFSEPSTAVLRAIEFQRAIYANREHLTLQNYTLTVKIGIHVGQVAVENSLAPDIFGRHVNRASRIESMANGGQILTSLAVWENAVGWLKDHHEDKIAWVSYGKTTLKGVAEKVDIFAFYPIEFGKPSMPKIFSKKKLNTRLLLLGALILLSVLSYFLIKKVNNKPPVVPSVKKYYVQFDFSKNKLSSNSDTLALQETLLSQIIAVVSPDSVITETDLIKLCSEQGKLYIRRNCADSNDEKYFKDTLHFSGALFVQGNENTNLDNDSIRLNTGFFLWTENMQMADNGNFICNPKDLKSEFRNWIQDRLMAPQLNTVQGFVSDINDSVLLFKISSNAKLRVGAAISFNTVYSGKEGFDLWNSDHNKRVEYLKSKPQYAQQLQEELKAYEESIAEVEQDLTNNKSEWTKHLGIKGDVMELFDTTGKARWRNKGIFPFVKPRKGDQIYLTY